MQGIPLRLHSLTQIDCVLTTRWQLESVKTLVGTQQVMPTTVINMTGNFDATVDQMCRIDNKYCSRM